MTLEQYLSLGAKPGDQLEITLAGKPMLKIIRPLYEERLFSEAPFIRVVEMNGIREIKLEGIYSIAKK